MIPLILTGSTSSKRLVEATKIAKIKDGPDFHLLSPDPSITIEMVRELVKDLSQRPFSAAFAVAIIDRADKATAQAQNVLLKILEEPPDFAQIILTAPSESSLLITVVSRCQILDLGHDSHPKPDTNTQAIVKTLISGTLPEKLALLERLTLPKIQALDLIDQLILTSQTKLPESLPFLKSLTKARSQIDQNANIRLVIANLILSS